MASLSCCGEVMFGISLLLAVKKTCMLKLSLIAAKSETFQGLEFVQRNMNVFTST